MLKNGSYPERLKRRILGDNGHLSQNNNLPELALGTVAGKLQCRGCDNIAVCVAAQDCASDVYEVR